MIRALIFDRRVYPLSQEDGINNGAPGGFGEVTSAVVIVHPVINQGSTTAVQIGSQREEVAVTVADLDPVETDATGLAVVREIPPGTVLVDNDGGNRPSSQMNRIPNPESRIPNTVSPDSEACDIRRSRQMPMVGSSRRLGYISRHAELV